MKSKWLQRILSFVCAVGVMVQIVTPVYAAADAGALPEAGTQIAESVETEVQQPAEPEVQQPAEPEAQQPAEPEAQQPAEPEAQQPAEPETQQPAQPEQDEPAGEAAPAPAEEKHYVLNPISDAMGSHNYGKKGGPATVLYEGQTMPAGGILSMDLFTTTKRDNAPNLGMFYYYQDDDNFLYVGFDPMTHWYYQQKVKGVEAYHRLNNLDDLQVGVTSNLSVQLSGDTMTVIVDGKTATVSGMQPVAEALAGGRFGVFSKCHTVVEFGNVKLNGQTPTGTPTVLVAENGSLEEKAEAPAPSAKITVTGRIVDQNQEAVADAAVQLNEEFTATTGNDGAFQFEQVPSGEYTLTVSKDGYLTKTTPVKAEGTNLDLGDVELTKIEGRVWYVLNNTSGSTNHNYESDGGPTTAVFDGVTGQADQTISLNLKPMTTPMNFGVFYYFNNNQNWLYIGMDGKDHWYYQWNKGGNGQYPPLKGLPTPKVGETMHMTISLSNEVLSVQVNDKKVTLNDPNLLKLSEALKDNKNVKIGVMTKGVSKIGVAELKVNNQVPEGKWRLLNPKNGSLDTVVAKLYDVNGTVVDSEGNPMEEAVVRADNQLVRTDAEGKYVLHRIENGTYKMSISKPGYKAVTQEFTVQDAAKTLDPVALYLKEPLDLTKFDVLENDELKAWVGKKFPYVIQYEMKNVKDAEGKPAVFMGQAEEELTDVVINNRKITATLVGDPVKDGASQTYVLNVKNAEANIDLNMTVEIRLEGASLSWSVTKIEKNKGCGPVDIIDIPGLNLLTVTDLEDYNAPAEKKPYIGFDGAMRSTVTTIMGDQHIGFGDGEGFSAEETGAYLYGFLSNGTLSAGLWSNSEIEKDNRVKRVNGADCISLTSSAWYYEHGDMGAQGYAYNKNIGDRNELVFPKSELPKAKVSFAGDANNDQIINWNDGAIAFRKIYNVPMGSDVIKDTVNYRIVMNFASMAPNPYLKTADNIRKVYLATDGLPQAVMLKGYGNEGHDSANSEYADIAEREGGVEDFRELLQIAHKYNTEIGVHVNAQEAYPEAKSFCERMLGRPYMNIGNGWGWLDQSHVIDKIWDLTSNNRWKRLVQFYDRINGTNFNTNQWPTPAADPNGTVADMATLRADAEKHPDNMDFIYLDVWYQDSWETRRIAEQFNSLGWRFSTEFSDQGEYDSTWQHWATDAKYGGAGMKGFNSEIIRFIRNDQRDSQVLNHPAFGGTADNPLLGGYRLYGFEGWGGDQDFNRYVQHTFLENLPTRFLQQYQVTKWVDYTGENGDVSPVGNQEKEITLQDANGNTVVVSRNNTKRGDDIIERIITLNGDKVLEDDAYLLPWRDYQDEQDKLYHFNWDGGETTWTLTGSFKGATSLVCYELTDQGRVNPTVIPVNGDQITLNAQAKVPYVLVRTAAVKELKDSFGDKNYVADPGFNGYADGQSLSDKIWKGDVANKAVTVRKVPTGEQNLVFGATTEPVAVSTTIRDLVPGEHYVAEIYVDNQSDSRATMSVDTGKKVESAYTMRSIAGNYVGCDENHLSGAYPSKLQRIQVPFVADKDTAVFTLAREAGEGSVYWNDIRIVKIKVDNIQLDGSFKQDFESVVQGLYPFVLGPAQGVNDPRTHLAQLHAPFTQSGWHTKVLDDVIDGEWSLKHHENNTGIIYQTIPQNFRFEPGKSYRVEFDYQAGHGGAYAMAIGDGENYTVPTQFFPSTAGAKAKTEHHSMNVVGSASGQTWIGLYCNGTAEGNDMGERDFILDNLTIREMTQAEIDKEIGITLSADKTDLFKGETAKLSGTNLDKATWKCSDEGVIKLDTETMTVSALKEGTATITASLPGRAAATEASVTFQVRGGVMEPLPMEGSQIVHTINGQPSTNANTVLDGKPGTSWDGKWENVSQNNPAGFIIDLGKEVDASGFRMRQRNSWHNNGRILGYRFSFGTEYDANTHEIVGATEMSQWFETPEDLKDKPGAWIPQRFVEDGTAQKVRYIKIEAYGTANNLTVSEVDVFNEKQVATQATVEDLTLKVGESAVLKAVPAGDTLLKGLVWSTQDTKIIHLNESGRVSAVAAGTATVTVTNAAGLKATGTVTVEAAPAPVEPPVDPDPSEKPDVKPDQKPDVKPDVKPDQKPDVKPQAPNENNNGSTQAPAAQPQTPAKPAAKPANKPASKPAGENQTQVDSEDIVYIPVQNELTEVPAELAKLDAVNTVEKIHEALFKSIQEKLAALLAENGDLEAFVSEKMDGLTADSFKSENFELSDVELVMKKGDKEIPVTHENFPKDGLTIILPYPQGTSGETHVFMVSHMLTEDHNGLKAGDVEILPVQAVSGGLQIHVTSLSPIGISWTEKTAEVEEQPVVEPQTEAEQPESSSNMMLWLILAAAAVIAVVVVLVVRRKGKKA